jgi:hypothetical protein
MAKTEADTALRALDNVYHVFDPIYTHMAVKYDMWVLLYKVSVTPEQREGAIQTMCREWKERQLITFNLN